jgi:putative membrane protein
MTLQDLPTLNASLNALCAVFLILGVIFIKRKNVVAHRLSMGTAFAISCLFLTSYLYYHAHVGSKRFIETGFIRTVYFTILLTHTVLATVIVPLILRTFFLAYRQRIDEHRRWARWTWPLWMYVSITGVIIYRMLYH